jgi:hypothetical protein
MKNKEIVMKSNLTAPVVIGGVGGSGTRLIAQVFRELNYYFGYDLNDANDNLWFTLIFNRPEVLNYSPEEFNKTFDIFMKGMTGEGNFTNDERNVLESYTQVKRYRESHEWLLERKQTLLSTDISHKEFFLWLKNGMLNSRYIEDIKAPLSWNKGFKKNDFWGWKEPNSHLFLDKLINIYPDMKYIHVVRNGLDMAHSKNQGQLNFWGKHIIGDDIEYTPYYSLKYWATVHKRIIDIGKDMGKNFLMLSYDEFCAEPNQGLDKISDFIELDISNLPKNKLVNLISPPKSIGRYKQFGLDCFDANDVAFAKSLGFDTSI